MIIRASVAMLALSMSPALAQELTVYGGAALEFSLEPNGSGSENQSAASGYVELERGSLYGGIWAEFSNFEDENEVDLYFGYRSSTESGLDYDFAYTRYIYPNDGGDCCGELSAVFGYTLGETLYPNASVYIDPENGVGSAYVGLEAYVADKWTLSANYGVYETDGAPSEREWDFGVGYALGEETALDLRYYEGSDYDGYFALELTYDTTILSR